jgi:catechol 2,3-dioxygenase-like lactoylglutathione lyase family enzyme
LTRATPRAQLESICPFFIVRDLDPSIAFYVDSLGFKVTFKGPTDDPYFAIVERDGARLMLKAFGDEVLPLPNPKRHPWARWDAYINVSEVDSLYSEFRDRGIAFQSVLDVNSDNLRGFELQDADGYVLYFGRPSKPGDPPPNA